MIEGNALVEITSLRDWFARELATSPVYRPTRTDTEVIMLRLSSLLIASGVVLKTGEELRTERVQFLKEEEEEDED